jgi:hypothetical protein
VLPVGVDRLVSEHELPAFTCPELGLYRIKQDIRGCLRLA